LKELAAPLGAVARQGPRTAAPHGQSSQAKVKPKAKQLRLRRLCAKYVEIFW
jgi:hypothetical protein